MCVYVCVLARWLCAYLAFCVLCCGTTCCWWPAVNPLNDLDDFIDEHLTQTLPSLAPPTPTPTPTPMPTYAAWWRWWRRRASISFRFVSVAPAFPRSCPALVCTKAIFSPLLDVVNAGCATRRGTATKRCCRQCHHQQEQHPHHYRQHRARPVCFLLIFSMATETH